MRWEARWKNQSVMKEMKLKVCLGLKGRGKVKTVRWKVRWESRWKSRSVMREIQSQVKDRKRLEGT